MKKRWLYPLCGVAALVAAAAVAWALRSLPPSVGEYASVERAARISPDYTDAVIPPNFAPLNFVVQEPGTCYRVRISSAGGKPIDIFSRSPGIVIPIRPWKRLLDANRGGKLTFDVYVRSADGSWTRFAPLTNTIAREDIDGWVVYREMPVYNMIWSDMRICQRDLRNYDVSLVLDNKSFVYGCMNCHTFWRNLPDRMAMNVRRAPPFEGKPPGGMLLARDGVVTAVVDTATTFNPMPATYLAWHPSGKAISFSKNAVLQCFNTIGDHRDVIDRVSDLGLYLIESNTVTTTPEIARPDRQETFTEWTPDGRTMYYCSAPKLPMNRYKESRYDLMRIPYDLDTNTWGRPETVISARDTGLSVSIPKFSPDGRFLLFCMARYGAFPAFRSSSDLYMMDMKTGKYRHLDINSYRSEAYHAWSSNSRWFVFSSKRGDGLFTRLYFSYVDEEGKAYKPVILPQKDPAFYDSFLRIYNVPELIREPMKVTRRDLVRAIWSPEKMEKAKLDARVKPRSPEETPTKDETTPDTGYVQ